MAKSIHLHLDNEIESMMKIILSHPIAKDDFEGEASLLRQCTKKYLKQRYPELLLQSFEKEDE